MDLLTQTYINTVKTSMSLGLPYLVYPGPGVNAAQVPQEILNYVAHSLESLKGHVVTLHHSSVGDNADSHIMLHHDHNASSNYADHIHALPANYSHPAVHPLPILRKSIPVHHSDLPMAHVEKAQRKMNVHYHDDSIRSPPPRHDVIKTTGNHMHASVHSNSMPALHDHGSASHGHAHIRPVQTSSGHHAPGYVNPKPMAFNYIVPKRADPELSNVSMKQATIAKLSLPDMGQKGRNTTADWNSGLPPLEGTYPMVIQV